MLTDETNSSTSTSIESACLPIGCSVSAKYRGAFCSAKVKTVDRQVKLKVTLFNTGDTVIISEEDIAHPVPLCIGNTVLIHTPNSHHSRSGLAALINDNHQKHQGTIKQIYDNSVYTVVFNDGDEKSLRRSSLCLHGIRLYQTKIGQQKLIEDIPTSSATPKDQNDMASIVAVCRNANQAFPALILKRKSLADYIWVKSFVDGREYIVHKRDDVESYNNTHIQSVCRATSKQATKACERYIKQNQIPLVWQKKKKRQHHNDQEHGNDSNTSESDIDDSDNETTEEKDSFVAQLFAFMDDRGTPINNIPKIHNYDLDLHRLFKVVRMFGGYNKVTKNDQWSRVYIKMGLPDEPSAKNSRAIDHAYKKYLFAYEDLSKKLGTMNAPSTYFGGRTSMSSDSRRSLIRVRQQSEEKKPPMPIKQTRKRLSVDSKPTLPSIKNQPSSTATTTRRKTIIIKQSISSSESDTSDTETSTNTNNTNNKIKKNPKKIISTIKKPPIATDDKKKTTGTKNSSIDLRSNSAPVRKSRSTTESEDSLKPVIKIPKITYEVFMESALSNQRNSKRQTSTSNPPLSNSIKRPSINDLTPLQITPVSPSPPPSATDESSSISVSVDTPSILQTIIPSSIPNHHQSSETENLSSNSNKRSYENCEPNQKIDEPVKRSRHSQDSNDKTPQRHNRLIYDDISMNDILLVKFDFNQKKEYHGKCLEKNNTKKQLLIHYQGLDSKYNEWIDIDRVIQRIPTEESKSDESDTGIWKSLLSEDIDSSTTPEKYYPPTENRVSNIEHIIPITSDNLLHSLTVQEEIVDNSSEPIQPCVLSIAIPPSPPDNRRTSIRQQQRRTFQNTKDSSGPLKKRTRFDFDYNSNFNIDNATNGDNSPIPIEQESKRCRTVGKRSVKRTVNQQDNEIEDFHLNSPINITIRQQLEDMFKHRSSRYNFLDLNNNLTGDRRLAHLKDRMRQCQKVFFNLKGALTKIEKQRKIFLRRQKLLLPSTTTNDLLLPSTCT